MSSRARSTSSTTSSTTAVRPTQRYASAASMTEIARRGSRTRFAHQRRGVRELSRIRPSGSRRYQTTAWRGDPSSSVVATEATNGCSRNARMASGRSGVVAGIGPWYVGGRAARAAARRWRRRRLPPSAPTLRSRPWSRRPPMLSGRRVTWFAYAYLCVVGFLLYAIGALTPYLRDALHLSAAEAALHASVLAVGLMVAGVVGGRGRTTPRSPAGGRRRRRRSWSPAAWRSCSAASSR